MVLGSKRTKTDPSLAQAGGGSAAVPGAAGDLRMDAQGGLPGAGGGFVAPSDGLRADAPGAASGKPAAKPRRSVGQTLISLLIVLLFLFGACVMLYPAAYRLYNEYLNARISVEYDQAVSALDPEARARALDQARLYNDAHIVNMIYDPFGEQEYLEMVERSEAGMSPTYDELLNIMGDGVMGYIDIPKIGQKLPIYHGTTVEALDRGVGHLHGTSLPIGGVGSHCVLSGHRGLPTAKLFTDLDALEEGDTWVVSILGERFAYEVYAVDVVLPEEADSLAIFPGEDLMTLVTCTPYGVNSHRMLVHGKRVDYVPDTVDNIITRLALFSQSTIVLSLVTLALVVTAFVVLVRRLRRTQ